VTLRIEATSGGQTATLRLALDLDEVTLVDAPAERGHAVRRRGDRIPADQYKGLIDRSAACA